MRTRRDPEQRQGLRGAVFAFFVIFACNAFIITCSFFIFFQWIDVDMRQIPYAAVITFGNVIALTLLFLIFYLIRNHFAVTRPVRKIRGGLQQITNGDLTTRIPLSGKGDAFDSIADSINRMTAELSSVETLKTDFISNVSHEIKTPISVIRNYSQLLQSPELTEEQRLEYARAVSDASDRLSGLITNILKLNRLENQQITLNAQEFDLTAQLTECLLGFEQIWEEKNIEIDPQIEEGVIINSDPELLSIVWNNLLSNAFKFTDTGGKVGVSLRSEKDRKTYVVEISDSGCGISPEACRHIFDQFYQGDTSRSSQGNGLGLALVRRIIDITGSKIDVRSRPGEGSTFTVRLSSDTP